MDDIESLGLLKRISWVLRITMIEKTVSLINQSTGKTINIDNLPRNDGGKTFDLIGRGDLEVRLQLESSGMKQVVKDLNQTRLRIFHLSFLYRPGPLDAGLIPNS